MIRSFATKRWTGYICHVSVPVEFECRNFRGDNIKFAKRSFIIVILANTFNNRLINVWKSLSNDLVMSPSVCI